MNTRAENKSEPRRSKLFSILAGILAAILALLPHAAYSQTRDLKLQFTPADTSIKFTLGDILHTIHGSFELKRGTVEYDFADGGVRGILLVDATSGQSGNRSRDRRMHKDILESAKFPEFVFRPDHVEGKVLTGGLSTIQVHGILSIHGADHELTMPIRVQVFPDHWIADTHFTIPYVKWGIKNPSTFFLRVSESVEIDVHATGAQPFQANGMK